METLFKDIGMGVAIALSTVGSSLGCGAAAMGEIGAWKRCFVQNKSCPCLVIVFIGFLLSQTIYGMILMGQIAKSALQGIS